MTTFTEQAREYGNCTVESLPPWEQRILLGLYLLQEYGQPNEHEPMVEGVPPEVMIELFQIWADDAVGEGNWINDAQKMIGKTYMGLIQAALDEANKEPWWASGIRMPCRDSGRVE